MIPTTVKEMTAEDHKAALSAGHNIYTDGPYMTPRRRELEAMWNSLDFKIYVVTFTEGSPSRKVQRKRENRYIRVNEPVDNVIARKKAMRAAAEESIDFHKGRGARVSVRMADPVSDLGCVKKEVA